MNQPVITLRITGYYVEDADGNRYAENGHGWFAKDIARTHARRIGGMYYPGQASTVKEVITGYTEN